MKRSDTTELQTTTKASQTRKQDKLSDFWVTLEELEVMKKNVLKAKEELNTIYADELAEIFHL